MFIRNTKFTLSGNKTIVHTSIIEEELCPAIHYLELIVSTRYSRAEYRMPFDKVWEMLLLIGLKNNESELVASNLFNELFSDLQDDTPIVLRTDEKTKYLPWEVILRNNLKQHPICLERIFTRLPEDVVFNEKRTSIYYRDNAFVLTVPYEGDTITETPNKVTAILQQGNVDCEISYREALSDIFGKLYINYYKVIHLTGHWVVNRRISGIYVTDTLMLTIGELVQMQYLPELLFCHLSFSENDFKEQYASIASYARDLLAAGVKAVIINAWNVEETSANSFISVFYKYLLEGFSFGTAVRKARSGVFENTGSINQLGAWQSYGDISYRLAALNEHYNDFNDTDMSKNKKEGIFISYSHRDKQWLDKIRTFLKPVLAGEKITLWTDENIEAGENWENRIIAEIDKARLVILLVSADFLASDYIVGKELPLILKNHAKGDTLLYWIPIGEAVYESTPLREIQSAGNPGRPLDSLSPSESDKELKRIAIKIGNALAASALGNTLNILDEIAGKNQRLEKDKLTDELTLPESNAGMVRAVDNEIKIVDKENRVLERITVDDLDKLSEHEKLLIRTIERSMDGNYEEWTMYYNKSRAVDDFVRQKARQQMGVLESFICEDWQKIIRFLQSMGKELSGHYQHIRFICEEKNTN